MTNYKKMHVSSGISGEARNPAQQCIGATFASLGFGFRRDDGIVRFRKLVAWFTLLSFFGQTALSVAGTIVADPTAPATQQPIILNTANGVPQVNIQTPSSAGVSRNTYSQFDVTSQGAILNNSAGNVQTQLGGWVQGNPALARGTARVILNEVNTSNPSLLNGFIEVAGDRAQVVIANPAGISCNGCGFINANRATLTTGTPVMNGGSLEGYVVERGRVTISGNGFDASQTDYADIIARSVEINAGFWANELNVTAGGNQVNADHTQIMPIAGNGSAPAFAVDVAQLGGMYAGKIRLIGTEAGVGVRNAGAIGASVGEVALTVDGQLVNSGSITATTRNDIAAQSIVNTGGTLAAGTQLMVTADSLTGDGNLLSTGDLAVTLTSDYTHTGQLQANGNATLTTTGNIANQGDMLAGGTLALTAADIDNAAIGEIAGLDTHLNASGTLTNRGTIDGGDTFLDAGALNNLGTGRIYGDHLAIAAGTLGNVAETLNGTTSAPVIAARDRLDIGADSITNSEGALLFSAGDLAVGGSLDVNHQATAQAGQLINEGATIEALGNAQMAVADLQNLNAGLVTDFVVDSTERIIEVQPENWSQRYDISHFPSLYNYNVEAQPFVNDAGVVTATFEDYTYYDYTATTRSTHIVSSLPGQILAGGNMTLTGNLLNSDSQVVAGGTLDVSGATLQNLTTAGQQVISYSGTRQFRDWDGNDEELEFGAIVAYNPASQTTNSNLATTQLEDNAVAAGSGTVVAGLSAPTLSGGLFQAAPGTTASYFIETDPSFASYRTWLSSDYMMQQLSFDPVMTQKRLGDGFYEQRLIREQIAQLTGRRFLDGYASDEAQYQALMSSGVTLAGALQLIPGIALSAEQMAQLTSDIVWLVQENVTLPDGTVTQTLVPRVYVRLQTDDLSPTVGLMAGNTVKINLSGDVVDSGTIAGRQLLTLDADNIRNLGGQMTADAVDIEATRDIDIQGGAIAAKNALVLDAGQDLTVASTTVDAQNSSGASTFSRLNINRVAGLYVTGDNGILVASADRDIALNAADIANRGVNGTTLIDAGNNLTLGTVTIAEQNNSIHNAKDLNLSGRTQDIGAVIQTQGDIRLNAGNDLNVRGASVTSEQGTLKASAGNDLRIESGQATYNSDIATHTKRSGTLSSRTKEQRDTFKENTGVVSTFSADTVTLQAGNYIGIKGSNIVGTHDVSLEAANDIAIQAAAQTFDESHAQETSKSGVFSSGGAGFTVGSQKLATTNDTKQVVNLGSTVGSLEGDVTLGAGKTYTQTGSDVLALHGDINIAAQKVDINAAADTYNNRQITKFKQSGLSVGLNGGIISSVQNTIQETKAVSDSGDSRIRQLANAVMAMDDASRIKSNVIGIQQGYDKGGLTGAVKSSGISLNVSIGVSKSSSSSTQTVTRAVASKLAAEGDVNITAIGAGKASDITVQGSSIKAGNDIALKAEDAITLSAAQNSATQTSRDKSSSANVGLSIGVSADGVGVGINASASQARGKADGRDVIYSNTHVDAANKLTLESGGDTTLKGAVAEGKQVIATIGGNLNLESLQDTSTYKSQQQSAGVGISVPIVGGGAVGGSISASQAKAKGNYVSVVEQTGIKAGDEGFNISTQGNTDLTGAVIASTDQAVQDNKNSLTTATLTYRNLQNHTEASASSDGLNLTQDVFSKYGAARTALATAYQNIDESEHRSSVTQSAIEQGSINITAQYPIARNISDDNAMTISRDTQSANQPVIKLDAKAMEQQVAREAQQRAADVALVTRVTDDAYRVMFRETPKFYKATCPAGADCVANPKLVQVEPVTGTPEEVQAQMKQEMERNGGGVFAVNGIQNGIERGVELAFQNAEPLINPETGQKDKKPETIYLMHYQPANSTVGEMIVAGYEKLLTQVDSGTANFLGYTNPDTTYAQTLQGFGNNAVNSLGHSRGTLVQTNAFNILGQQGYTNNNLTARGVGGAVTAQEYTGAATQIVGQKNKDNVSFNYYSNDPVSTLAGGNPGNSGVMALRDLWTVLAGGDNTQHSCYGTGAAGCAQVEIPAATGPKGTNDNLIQYQGGERVNNNSTLN